MPNSAKCNTKGGGHTDKGAIEEVATVYPVIYIDTLYMLATLKI